MRALVLSGGAVKGAYEAGVISRWMGEDAIDYDILCGVSVGGINTAFVCQTPLGKPKDASKALLGLWQRVTTDQVYKHWCPLGPLEALWKPSVFNSMPLQDWIRGELDAKAIAASGRLLRVGAVAWDNGEYRCGTEKDADIADWVIASASFPVFLRPVEIGGRLWSDGGLRNVTPLGEAIRLGADEIDVVMCTNPDLPIPWPTEGKAAVPGFLLRTLDLMCDEIIRTDLQVCGLKNDLARLDESYRQVKVRVVQPMVNLVEDSLKFDQPDIQRMIAQGYEDSGNIQAIQTLGIYR
jgi:NTE family protein